MFRGVFASRRVVTAASELFGIVPVGKGVLGFPGWRHRVVFVHTFERFGRRGSDYLREVPAVTVQHQLAAEQEVSAGQAVSGPSPADLDVVIDGLLAGVDDLSGSQASERLAQVSRSAARLSAYRVALVSKVQSSQVWRAKGACQMVCVRGGVPY